MEEIKTMHPYLRRDLVTDQEGEITQIVEKPREQEIKVEEYHESYCG